MQSKLGGDMKPPFTWTMTRSMCIWDPQVREALALYSLVPGSTRMCKKEPTRSNMGNKIFVNLDFFDDYRFQIYSKTKDEFTLGMVLLLCLSHYDPPICGPMSLVCLVVFISNSSTSVGGREKVSLSPHVVPSVSEHGVKMVDAPIYPLVD